ncbi:cell division protein FtsZ [Hephaestia caeni]|uniref:Cell division protein FtsZ n=1 Tax=Hephaestia caeni TaxID=645617 RepID=A0A397PIF6_9SPHN|nr:cell division protein FtsZ [Hephaestia caeni]RIA47055.1 cell division protein FtsZ [Hephaestia caeni]
MSIEFLTPEADELTPRIAVIGVGGAGGNAIANMMRAEVQGVDFLVANTDAQALKQSSASSKIQLGAKITQGLGAGSRPEIGRAAAEETIDDVTKMLEGAHMCFIAAGMGGGTGTGAAPVIAKAARDMGILTVGVVTKPFSFEGSRRAKSADAGIEELQKFVDTLIVIPNQNLFLIANANTTFKEAFQMADEVLQQGVRGITDLMVMPGLINLDFADVRSVMQEMGKAMMGTGEADGDARALEAAQKAIANPLLDGVSMQGAKGVIISITGGEDMRLLEVDEAANHIRELVDPDANIIWGSAFNPDLDGKIRVSVVATGIDADAALQPPAQDSARVFSFSTPKKTAPAPAPDPVADEPAAEAIDSPVEEAPITEEAPIAAEAAAEEPVRDGDADTAADPLSDTADITAADDELVLGSDTIVPEAPKSGSEADALANERPNNRRRWLSAGSAAGESVATASEGNSPVVEKGEAATSPAPKVKLGGTLFERMSSVSRGTRGEDAAEDKDALDIPRFLHRQNNQ